MSMAALSFTWTPDPQVYAQRALVMADMLEDMRAPLMAASETVQMDIRERFTTETDPEGNPWEPWAESYEEYANMHNAGILHQTGALEEVASSSRAVVVRNDTVFYETSHLPHYGLAHDQGLEDRKNPLPQREFLGMSDEAKGAVFAEFSEWFEGITKLWVTPSGRIGRRHALQGPGGFVSRASVGLGPMRRF